MKKITCCGQIAQKQTTFLRQSEQNNRLLWQTSQNKSLLQQTARNEQITKSTKAAQKRTNSSTKSAYNKSLLRRKRMKHITSWTNCITPIAASTPIKSNKSLIGRSARKKKQFSDEIAKKKSTLKTNRKKLTKPLFRQTAQKKKKKKHNFDKRHETKTKLHKTKQTTSSGKTAQKETNHILRQNCTKQQKLHSFDRRNCTKRITSSSTKLHTKTNITYSIDHFALHPPPVSSSSADWACYSQRNHCAVSYLRTRVISILSRCESV